MIDDLQQHECVVKAGMHAPLSQPVAILRAPGRSLNLNPDVPEWKNLRHPRDQHMTNALATSIGGSYWTT